MNCISECRQQYMQKYCGCSLSTFFPIGNNSDCNFEDLKCLFQFNGKSFKNFICEFNNFKNISILYVQMSSIMKNRRREIHFLMMTTREWNVHACQNAIELIMQLKLHQMSLRKNLMLYKPRTFVNFLSTFKTK